MAQCDCNLPLCRHHMHLYKNCSLSDLLLRAVLPSIINTLREVLDEADALSYADLLLLCQLGGQTGLTRRGVVHGHMSRLLVAEGEEKYTSIKQTNKQEKKEQLTSCFTFTYFRWTEKDTLGNKTAVLLPVC